MSTSRSCAFFRFFQDKMGACLRKQLKTEDEILKKHYEKYEKHLLPLEKISLFNELVDPPYSEADVLAKPIILIAGQYSTGKTTFIKVNV